MDQIGRGLFKLGKCAAEHVHASRRRIADDCGEQIEHLRRSGFEKLDRRMRNRIDRRMRPFSFRANKRKNYVRRFCECVARRAKKLD